jgi:hypothetical protein
LLWIVRVVAEYLNVANHFSLYGRRPFHEGGRCPWSEHVLAGSGAQG